MNRTVLPLALILFCYPAAPAADPVAKALEEQMQKLIDEVSPSVVSVVVSHQKYPGGGKGKPGQLGDYEPAVVADDLRPWPRRGTPAPNRLDLSLAENAADNLFGSGVVLDPKAGLILVPYHLIEGATKVYVRSSAGKGGYADIHAADSKSDLAVLKLISAPAGLKAVKLAEVQLVDTPDGKKTNLKRGSWAVAVGHPLATGAGDGVASASWGIVSNVGRRSAPVAATPGDRTPKPLHAYGGLIQLDARVTLGSSGAGVFNLDGQLVGLGSSVAAVYGSEANGGYAVPMDANYRRIVETLQAGREVEYGFLGITPTEEARGVGASTVSPGCPAANAGFRGGDVITSIDGHPLKHPDDLLLYIGAALAGSDVTLEYLRGGEGPTRTAKVTLAKNANPLPFIASVPPPAAFGLRVEYQSTKFAGPVVGFGARQQQNPVSGVVIRDNPEPGSPADKRFQGAGTPRGYWVITHVDGRPVSSPPEYNAAVKGKSSVKLVLADSEDPTNRQTITLP